VKASQEELRESLRGRVTKHHRFLLRLHLNQIDLLMQRRPASTCKSKRTLRPFAPPFSS
jgi:transposase